MKTYIPSEEELVELGFEIKTYTWENGCGFFYLPNHDESERWWYTVRRIYPRSKAHLESIILAFKKPIGRSDA